MMNGGLEAMWKQAVVICYKVLFRHSCRNWGKSRNQPK